MVCYWRTGRRGARPLMQRQRGYCDAWIILTPDAEEIVYVA